MCLPSCPSITAPSLLSYRHFTHLPAPYPRRTPYYIAPEVLNQAETGNRGYTSACDCWSLGVIAYMLVSAAAGAASSRSFRRSAPLRGPAHASSHSALTALLTHTSEPTASSHRAYCSPSPSLLSRSCRARLPSRAAVTVRCCRRCAGASTRCRGPSGRPSQRRPRTSSDTCWVSDG